MNGCVVVDASLAVKWLVKEVYSDRAFRLASLWASQDVQPVAPYLMPVEVANVLHRRVIRREVAPETALRLMDSLLASGIELREPRDLHRQALLLAARLRQNAVYDAHYLALAETLNCELWTADERFYRAASPTIGNIRWLGEADSNDV